MILMKQKDWLIDDIRVDMNKFKASKEDKKVLSNLNRLIIGINNNKGKKKILFKDWTKEYLTWIN